MRWPKLILIGGTVFLTGCAPPAWERVDAHDIKGKSAMAAVESFVTAKGWNMNKSPFALFRPGGGQQGRLRGLPWSNLANGTYPIGLAYNPNTNLKGASSPQDKLFACPADVMNINYLFTNPPPAAPPRLVKHRMSDSGEFDYSSFAFNGGDNVTRHFAQGSLTFPGLTGIKLSSVRHPETERYYWQRSLHSSPIRGIIHRRMVSYRTTESGRCTTILKMS